MSEQRKRLLGAAGVFVALLGLYGLTMPGRIDSVDGRWRYDASKNWLDAGDPCITNPSLLRGGAPLRNPMTGHVYSYYNAAPSVTPMPWMVLSRWLPGQTPARDQFAFSLAGPVFGALLGALLVLAYGMLGVGLRQSLLYTAIFCLATLWWPGSVTVLDQNQHAVLLFGSLLVGWQSGRRRSTVLAGLAGLLGGLLLNYQESYALLLPVLGISVLASAKEGSSEGGAALRQPLQRGGLPRYAAFAAGCCVGLGLFFAYNDLRFGSLLALMRYASQGDAQSDFLATLRWGDPLAGLLGLALSPGKGIFWFSPPLVLALCGGRRLLARAPVLALAAAGTSVIYLLLVIQFKFFGGDWCWGPRYVLSIMPLCALALPFAIPRAGAARRLVLPLTGLGLLVQLLGVSVDHHQFFYEANLPVYFWAEDPWVYFKHSQLLARPAEIYHSLPGAPQRPRQPEATRLWPQPGDYPAFFFPRSWWGWVGRVRPELRPVEPAPWIVACGALLALGSLAVVTSLRVPRPRAFAQYEEGERRPTPAPTVSYPEQGSA